MVLEQTRSSLAPANPKIVQEGNPDRILDFTHSNFSIQNNDILDFQKPITAYYVDHVFEGIRIVTAEGQLKEGSILLSGVSSAQWLSWHGSFGWQFTSTPGLINLESNPQNTAQGTSPALHLGVGANEFDHTGAHLAQPPAQPAPDSSAVFDVALGQLHDNLFAHMHAHGLLLV